MDILVVDDDEDLADILCLLLRGQGYSVEYMNCATTGKERLLGGRYDLIMLDWDLGDGTGIELLETYRRSGGLTPVLMMTGRAGVDDKELGLDSGADDYITKPFDMRELQARVKSLTRRAQKYSPAAALSDLGPGSIISDKYKLVSRIGEGGMAVVWLGESRESGRSVVVKIIHGHLLGTEEVLKRFEQEWRLLSKVQHKNVVSFLDAGTLKSGSPYLVMEYVKGRSLRHVLHQEGSGLPQAMVVQTLIQICDGLQAMHEQGIVHRDLKPDNIILQDESTGDDAVKIVDFGLARLMELGERLTRDDMVVGTLEYLSPEQLRNIAVDGRTDVYALGILMCELLTGKPPFGGDSPEAVMAQHLGGQPQLPSTVREGVSKELDRVAARALAKDQMFRYQSAMAMRRELESIVDEL